MTKEKVQKMREAILTEKEQTMIEWLARTSYETIRDDFWKEAKEEYFSAYMSVITMLYQHEKTNAMFFICILLDQGDHEDLAQLITKVCNVEDGGVDLFLNEFKDYLIYDMFYEEEDNDYEDESDDEDFDEDETELYDVNFGLPTHGIKLPSFRKKEADEDE